LRTSDEKIYLSRFTSRSRNNRTFSWGLRFAVGEILEIETWVGRPFSGFREVQAVISNSVGAVAVDESTILGWMGGQQGRETC
jgi:hypothetical protein